MALQDIANRLIGNLVAQIGQRARNPVIAPVLQFFDGVDAPSDGIEVCHAGDVA